MVNVIGNDNDIGGVDDHIGISYDNGNLSAFTVNLQESDQLFEFKKINYSGIIFIAIPIA